MFKTRDQRVSVKTMPSGVSRTKQSFKKDCDMQHILAKYQKTGVIEHRRQYEGRYGDFTNVTDYQTAMGVVIAAQNMFESLPSTVRKRFGNDPQQFLDFATNPVNGEELVKMGLAVRREPPPAAPEASPAPAPTPAPEVR